MTLWVWHSSSSHRDISPDCIKWTTCPTLGLREQEWCSGSLNQARTTLCSIRETDELWVSNRNRFPWRIVRIAGQGRYRCRKSSGYERAPIKYSRTRKHRKKNKRGRKKENKEKRRLVENPQWLVAPLYTSKETDAILFTNIASAPMFTSWLSGSIRICRPFEVEYEEHDVA